ncbi:unnamed protein product, partial [Schistocephalus solidus]
VISPAASSGPVGIAGAGGQQQQQQQLSPTVPNSAASALASSAIVAAGTKRFKWHLGIRSQSRPWDIMQEVFRAMSTLGYEWKVITPFNIRVRKWNPVLKHHFKIMLQLYQVDTRSYLLDFKCIDDTKPDSDGLLTRRRSGNVSVCYDSSCSGSPSGGGDAFCGRASQPAAQQSTVFGGHSAPESTHIMDTSFGGDNSGAAGATSPSPAPVTPRPTTRHQTMEFFELCTELITTLAR